MKHLRVFLMVLLSASIAFLSCSNKDSDLLTNETTEVDQDKPPVTVFRISLNKYKTTLFEGEKTHLISSFPDAAENKKTTWKSSDESVAKVDEQGLVTAISEGQASITAISDDQNKTASCQVVVTGTYNVLFIGNSFTQDAIENHFLSMINTAGLKDKINIHWMHLGGRTMAQHSAAYIIGSADYYYNTPNYSTAKWVNNGLTPLPDIVKSHHWNLITIQEHTGNKDAWEWDKYHKDNIET